MGNGHPMFQAPEQHGDTDSSRQEQQPPLARTSGLAASGLFKRFGGLDAIQNVSLDIAPGEVLGILGPNGAGKSTLINLLSGAYRADAGRVHLWGDDISAFDMAARAQRGLVRTFQNTRPSEELTPREILRIASGAPRRGRRGDVRLGIEELIETFGLTQFAEQRHSALPYGFQKVVFLAATALCRPRVLLLDEPFQGVSEAELERIASVIRRFQQSGVAIGLVEHNVGSVMALCERLIVLDAGRVIFSGPSQAALRDDAVQRSYLGSRFTRANV
jgi:ABC-type branched-subunit amino acid transport system ATPase component